MKKSFYSFLISIIICGFCSTYSINAQSKGKQPVKRFFSDQSFWNQTIPENPEIDPRNDKWIKLLEQEPTKENFGITWAKWTVPVYEVNEKTPWIHIDYHFLRDNEKNNWITGKNHQTFGHGPDFNPVPLPIEAKPDPEQDSHFAVVDWTRMLGWDMWGMRRRPDSTWESNTGMMYRLDGDGIYNGYELGFIDGESVHFHGPSRAAGVPAIAGLIRYDEVMDGEIRHKLSCASRYAAYLEFTYPATWTDGRVEGGIPEGALIQLDPALDLSPYKLTKEELVVAKALQIYGMALVDNAQGQPIYAEGLWGHPGKSWEGKLRQWEGGINEIPYKHFRVLKIKAPVYKGDEKSKKSKRALSKQK
jgi:hypothetical protein